MIIRIDLNDNTVLNDDGECIGTIGHMKFDIEPRYKEYDNNFDFGEPNDRLELIIKLDRRAILRARAQEIDKENEQITEKLTGRAIKIT